MPRVALFNIFLGFCTLFLAASAGTFIATDMTYQYLREKTLVDSWVSLLAKSAHGHTNLFALIHIALGLSMPHSVFGQKIKVLQTVGLCFGTFAMSILLFMRGVKGPKEGLDLLEVAIGASLSLALATIATHAFGIGARLLKRN